LDVVDALNGICKYQIRYVQERARPARLYGCVCLCRARRWHV